MKTSQMIQSKFLKKEDFDTPTVLTIKGCTLEDMGQGDTRWVLWLHENQKGLVLNVSKIRSLELAYGHDTDDWLGQKVKLSHDPSVMYAGKLVGGIKLQTSTKGAPAQKPEPVKDDGFGDAEIPFDDVAA